jgi:hypothetical protein
MALNFNSSSSNGGHGYIRYMASTASWQMDGDTIQMKQAIFDLENIKTGWCRIDVGVAPEWVMDASLEQSAPKPEGENWKRGFQVNIYSKTMFGNDSPYKEWGTNSTGATMGIQKLYADYEEANKGKGQLPVVEYSGATPTKIGKGSTNIPNFKILKFVDSPTELSGGASASPVTSSASDEIGDEF